MRLLLDQHECFDTLDQVQGPSSISLIKEAQEAIFIIATTAVH